MLPKRSPARARDVGAGSCLYSSSCTVRHLWRLLSTNHPSWLLMLEANASIWASRLCCCGEGIAFSPGSYLECLMKGLAWGADLAGGWPGGVLWDVQVKADKANGGRRTTEMCAASPGLFCRFLLRGRLWASLDDRAPVILKRSVPQINRDKDLRSYFPLCHLRFSSHIWLLHTVEMKTLATKPNKTNKKSRFFFLSGIS